MWYTRMKWGSNSNCNDCPDEYQSENGDNSCCIDGIFTLDRNLIVRLSNGTEIVGENILPVIPNNTNTFISNQYNFDNNNPRILYLYLNNDLINPHLSIEFPQELFSSDPIQVQNGLRIINGFVKLGGDLTENTTINLNGNNLEISGEGRVDILTNLMSFIIPNNDPSSVRSLTIQQDGFFFNSPIFIGGNNTNENLNLELNPSGEIVRVPKDSAGLTITPLGPNNGTNISKDFVAYYKFNNTVPTIVKSQGTTNVNLQSNRIKSLTLELDANNLKIPSSSTYVVKISNLPSTHYPIPNISLYTFSGTIYQIDYSSYNYKYNIVNSSLEIEISFPQMFPSETILRNLKIELA